MKKRKKGKHITSKIYGGGGGLIPARKRGGGEKPPNDLPAKGGGRPQDFCQKEFSKKRKGGEVTPSLARKMALAEKEKDVRQFNFGGEGKRDVGLYVPGKEEDASPSQSCSEKKERKICVAFRRQEGRGQLTVSATKGWEKESSIGIHRKERERAERIVKLLKERGMKGKGGAEPFRRRKRSLGSFLSSMIEKDGELYSQGEGRKEFSSFLKRKKSNEGT